MQERKELQYDLVILGGGPAGLSAAIYAARGAVKTAIIDSSILGGTPNNYLEIENYPALGHVSGMDLVEKFEAHVDMFEIDKHTFQEITKVDLAPEVKTIETNEFIFKAKTVIIATGAQPQKLNVQGELELSGRGVSYCAVCDGAFFKDKVVAVVGGGNAAVEEAAYLTKFASKVYIIHRRDKLRADKLSQERAFSNPKIEFIWDSQVVEVKGKDKVESALIRNVKTSEITELKTDGVFPYIGYTANTELFADQVQLDKSGFILTDLNLSTNCKGVFAAGDVRVTPLRQVITAAADGAITATSAIKHIEELETTHTIH